MPVRSLIAIGCMLALPALVQCKSNVGNDAQLTPPKAAHADASARSASSSASAHVVLEPPGAASITVRVELAETPEQRQQGLMYRKQLDPDAGMLFLFEQAQHNTFWMRNTYLPLDMIFITADWHILGIVENATPLTDAPRSVPGDSQYVLEVNAGFSRQHGLSAGTKVQFVREAR